MTYLTIDHVINEDKIAKTLFYHLSDKDLSQCALVNKTWYLAVRGARSHRKLRLTVEMLDKLNRQGEKFEDHIRNEYEYVNQVDIYGWSRGSHIPNDIYDNLFTTHFKAKTLILRGRGCWDSCKCPNEGTLCGEQINDINDEDRLTNLEYIHIGTTFCISSCALLDLVARSPQLKVLKFYGLLCKNDHNELFNRKLFHSDLERLYWPWPSKRHIPTMTTLVKRNENLTTFYSNSETTTELLSAEALPNLRHLSMCLNENWACKPGNQKKLSKHIQSIQYLSLAKNIEALEIRTFDIDESECVDTNAKVERIYENYKLAFWEQVSKLPNLKFLAIYGAWEFEKVCREMAKQNLQLEFLKINLTPSSVLSAVDAQEDCPVLSMADGIRNLKRLPKLRSLHYICYERLGSIDNQTVTALKEIMDLIWILDIKTGFTEEVEDLLNIIMRRGNQLGKSYKYYIHIQSKSDSNFANLLTEKNLKYPLGTILRDKIAAIAESETSQRYRKSTYENFHIWELEQVGNFRDPTTFEHLATSWKLYNEQFYTNPEIL